MQSIQLPINVKGHVKIEDDLGNILLDKDNAIHPQNIARVIARSLANENNFHIHRIAFGNGGTVVDGALQITYNTPNDGQAPDANTWDSRLYNETYSEIIDESNVNLGTDPTGGGGADPSGDPPSTEHISGPGVRSNELGLTSEVIITAVLNPGEPSGQFATDDQAPVEGTEGSFTFDEIGLFTTGGPPIDTSGFQNVDVGEKISTDDTGLAPLTTYVFTVSVDGGLDQEIEFTTPAAGSGGGGEILYGDLVDALNSAPASGWVIKNDTNGAGQATISAGNPAISGAFVSITDVSGSFPTIVNAQTFGFLKFESNTSGVLSTISLTDGATFGSVGADAFASLIPAGTILLAVDGEAAGAKNDPVTPTNERERLLAHLIFSPVLKSANRTLTVTYKLTVSVARSV
jgi:hypothetical protein